MGLEAAWLLRPYAVLDCLRAFKGSLKLTEFKSYSKEDIPGYKKDKENKEKKDSPEVLAGFL